MDHSLQQILDKRRMNISLKRNNVAPIEKINVGPGLNKGYTSLTSQVDFNNLIQEIMYYLKQLMKLRVNR